MDLIDQKFEKLKDNLYKLGIKPAQFRNMVESQSLFEWNPEVALALGIRFSSWIVVEEDAEHANSEDGRSVRCDSTLLAIDNQKITPGSELEMPQIEIQTDFFARK